MDSDKIFITKFDTTAQYNAAKDSLAKPHVSLTKDDGTVHYDKDNRVVVKFNVSSTSNPTKILSYIPTFAKVEIDGVEMTPIGTGYTFDTVGEHEVKYTLTDETTIGDQAFYYCTELMSITIPDSVTTIGNESFISCTSLVSLTIPKNVTSIGMSAFNACTNLLTISALPKTAPTITSSTFKGVKENGALYTLQGSSGYDVWMQNANYYLGVRGWTMNTIDNMEDIVAGGMD